MGEDSLIGAFDNAVEVFTGAQEGAGIAFVVEQERCMLLLSACNELTGVTKESKEEQVKRT